MADSDGLPGYLELMWLTLRAVRDLGGTASGDEIQDRVAKLADLSESQANLRRRPSDRIPILTFRLGWARTYLKRIGALDSPSLGQWTLTAFGSTMSLDEMTASAKALQTRRAQRRKLSERRSKPGRRRRRKPARGAATLDIHRRVLTALDGYLVTVPDGEGLARKPLDLTLRPPLYPLCRIFAFAARRDEKGRKVSSYRIQLTVGEAGAHNHFDRSDSYSPVLLGYAQELDVFVLWDAEAQDTASGFRYSKSCYVKLETVLEAASTGLAVERQHLRQPLRIEWIVAARASNLAEALNQRRNLTLRALVGG